MYIKTENRICFKIKNLTKIAVSNKTQIPDALKFTERRYYTLETYSIRTNMTNNSGIAIYQNFAEEKFKFL